MFVEPLSVEIFLTQWKILHLSRPVQKLYPLEIRSKREGLFDFDNSVRVMENPTRTVPQRSAALDL